jgi:uncharacterized protein (DUF4415 family)
MKKSKDTVRYTAREIEAIRREGGDRSDAACMHVTAKDAAAADDEEDFDWTNAVVGLPAPKQQLTVRLDSDVVKWFKAQGRGYQTRMNAVLRRFMDAQKNQPP